MPAVHVGIIVTKYQCCYLSGKSFRHLPSGSKLLRVYVGIFWGRLITWDLIISSEHIVNDLFVRRLRVRCHRVRLFACSDFSCCYLITVTSVSTVPFWLTTPHYWLDARHENHHARRSAVHVPRTNLSGDVLISYGGIKSWRLGWRGSGVKFVQFDRSEEANGTHRTLSRTRLHLIESLIYPTARSNLAYRQISIGSVLKKKAWAFNGRL